MRGDYGPLFVCVCGGGGNRKNIVKPCTAAVIKHGKWCIIWPRKGIWRKFEILNWWFVVFLTLTCKD